MIQPSYDLPDTATRNALREALDLRMETLKGHHLLLRADVMIDLARKLILPRDAQEVEETLRDLSREMRAVQGIAEEMRGIEEERDGL